MSVVESFNNSCIKNDAYGNESSERYSEMPSVDQDQTVFKWYERRQSSMAVTEGCPNRVLISRLDQPGKCITPKQLMN